MTAALQKEILKHIFLQLGISFQEPLYKTGFIDNLLDDKFLTDKKIGFENEEKKKFKNNIWAAVADVNATKVKILVADIQEDIKEYTILFQMDNLPAYALRLSADPDDIGSLFIKNNENWLHASVAIQGKFLYGIEGLSEILLQWNKLENYIDMYKLLIQFLNFYEKE